MPRLDRRLVFEMGGALENGMEIRVCVGIDVYGDG
jgi:hypothetical protein